MLVKQELKKATFFSFSLTLALSCSLQWTTAAILATWGEALQYLTITEHSLGYMSQLQSGI